MCVLERLISGELHTHTCTVRMHHDQDRERWRIQSERCLQIRVLISEGEMGARVALGVGNGVLFREVSSLSLSLKKWSLPEMMNILTG